MASPNPADYITTPSVASFYIDESILNIDGKPHLLSCAIVAEDNNTATRKVVELKASLGVKALDEIKFNSSGHTQEKKIYLTDGVLEIMHGCTMFICINEGSDKVVLAETVAQQCFD